MGGMRGLGSEWQQGVVGVWVPVPDSAHSMKDVQNVCEANRCGAEKTETSWATVITGETEKGQSRELALVCMGSGGRGS